MFLSALVDFVIRVSDTEWRLWFSLFFFYISLAFRWGVCALTHKSQLESSNCAVHYADWCTAFPHKRAFLQTFEGSSVSHKGLKSRQAWMHVACQIWSIIERQISFRCFSYLLLVGKCHGANVLKKVYSLFCILILHSSPTQYYCAKDFVCYL